MVDTQAFSRSEIINLIIRLALLTSVTFFSIKWMITQLDPTNKQKKKAKKKVSYFVGTIRWRYIQTYLTYTTLWCVVHTTAEIATFLGIFLKIFSNNFRHVDKDLP